jgi:D-sedoheptulose 7-phosphate isomerase
MLADSVQAYFRDLQLCYREVSLEKLNRVVDILLEAHRVGRKVFTLGNGGSAATASHMACDLGKGTIVPEQRRLRAICISDNVAVMTAWANDVDYESIFKEQLAALVEPEDVVIGISASGNSPNVLKAIEYANGCGAVTVGFAGFGGGKLKGVVAVDITISSRDYGQVEDFHLSLDHIITAYIKERLIANSKLSKMADNAVSALAT